MSVGSKWFKFDFHNHTPASDDYQEPSLSNRDWLLAYMNQEVDAVIVSDHNTGSRIDDLKRELTLMHNESESGDLNDYRPLTIFPGVELTATGNVHVLAVFDENSGGTAIEQLIGQCNGAEPIQTGLQNHQLVLNGGLADIVGRIGRYPNAISILAHIDGPKGALGITNQGELEAVFDAKPDAVEISNQLSDISNGTHRRLIQDVPKLRGSDAHHTDRAGTRTCWLKMSELNFDGLKIALLDHENCILIDSAPPAEPNLQLTKVQIKTKLCSSNEGQPIDLQFNPFYNAIIGSRGSGKSTLIESIRLGMRKDKNLTDEHTNNINSFKAVGQGMSSDSEIVCFYRKDGSDFKLTWSPNNLPTLHYLEEGEWTIDNNWSDDRFDISIYSQKMLYKLASDNDAFLKVCDDSIHVNKRVWSEQKNHLEREFKNERITLRGLLETQTTISALRGELADAERAIERLNDSSYYTVKTILNNLESEKSKIDRYIEEELSLIESISELTPDIPQPQLQEQTSQEHQACIQQLDSIQRTFRDQISSSIDKARADLAQLEKSQFMLELMTKITAARENVLHEASLLTEQGLDPNTLDSLVENRTRIQTELLKYSDLDSKITDVTQNITRIMQEMIDHRKALSQSRKLFIESLNLDGLEIKVLPLNAAPKSIISGYQSATGITSFTDKIYDIEFNQGLLKSFIEHQTFSPAQLVIDQKYTLLSELKDLHLAIARGEEIDQIDIHGAYKNRITSLSDEALDNLLCWFPDDGIQIRYQALSGRMENIESASPGQKAASMLQFLLSYGTDPLLIDQPEDDLDCLMLSQSVIPAIAENKQKRQLIIVSHSAPIVVNGDAEYVISMIHDRDGLRPNICGALQEQEVKNLICNQMEGGERAFRSRYSRILT